MKKITYVFLFYLVVTVPNACKKQESPKIETATTQRIFDGPDILSDFEEAEISTLIHELENNTGSQIGVVIIKSLKGEKIEHFSLRTATDINLGRSKFDDGLLIAIALDDHKVRIEVGYGLEKIIKDEITARINREEIGPRFKEEKYFEGIYAAVEKMKRLIEENSDMIGSKDL